jgi:hypothetical protein
MEEKKCLDVGRKGEAKEWENLEMTTQDTGSSPPRGRGKSNEFESGA